MEIADKCQNETHLTRTPFHLIRQPHVPVPMLFIIKQEISSRSAEHWSFAHKSVSKHFQFRESVHRPDVWYDKRWSYWSTESSKTSNTTPGDLKEYSTRNGNESIAPLLRWCLKANEHKWFRTKVAYGSCLRLLLLPAPIKTNFGETFTDIISSE